MIWALVALLAAIAALWVVAPFLRARVVESGGGDAAASIYADQLEEVTHDLEQGLISKEEAHAAEVEIERRRARAVREMPGGLSVAHRTPLAAAIGALLFTGVAIGGYAAVGTPEARDLPLLTRSKEMLEQRAAAGDINSRIQLLVERTKEDPENFESWWILARSYASVGDHANSAEAYRRAVMLDGNKPGILSAYAEAMTLANGNKVPEGAEIIFSQVAREAADPRAHYYLALARAQRKDFDGALEDWAALAAASSDDAPWMPLVRRDIVNMARFLDRDVVDYLPNATATEIATARGEALPADSPDAGALRTALAEDPMDHAGWIALARAEAAAGREDAAAEALAEGRRYFSAAPFVLQKFAEEERALGLDLTAPAPRGPDASDIAAASQMTEADRQQMIEGMVAGLAARLEETPNDPEGWAMLIRSYRTLGQPSKADAALETATGLFEGTPEMEIIRSAL